MKFKLRRAISMALLLSIGLSGIPIIPYTAYGAGKPAPGVVQVGTGQGLSSSGTGKGNGTLHFGKPIQQGIRFSVVDYEGNSVVTNADGEPLALDVVFSQPSGTIMKGNKLSSSYNTGDIRRISIGEFNLDLYTAITNEKYLWNDGFNPETLKQAKNKEELKALWNANCKVPYISVYQSLYPGNYNGLPVPVASNLSTLEYWGNGNAVKNFFTSGALGSITFTRVPTVTAENILGNETPSIPTSALVKEEEKLVTPYGKVAKAWLENHISDNSKTAASSLYTNGYILDTEKTKINTLLTGQDGFYKLGLSAALSEVASATTLDKAEKEIDIALSNLQKDYMGKLWGISEVRNGKITYEAMRVYNNGVISIYNNAVNILK